MNIYYYTVGSPQKPLHKTGVPCLMSKQDVHTYGKLVENIMRTKVSGRIEN